MSYLAQVTNKPPQVGQRIVIGGVEKIGKTTICCGAPNALLIPLEQGAGAIPVAQTPQLETWEQVTALNQELIAAAQAGKIARGSSIVWDSATALERIIENYTVRSDPAYSKSGGKVSMATAHGGYGKAYDVARQHFEDWLRFQDALALKGGINILVTCHVFASRVIDPAFGEYDTWDLLLHSPKNNKTYGIREYLTQWADMVGFFHEPVFVNKSSDGKFNQVVSKNEGRVIAVERSPTSVAGNRYGITGVIKVPPPQPGKLAVDSWNAIAQAIYAASGIDVWNRSK